MDKENWDMILKYGPIIAIVISLGTAIIGGWWARKKFNKQHEFNKEIAKEKKEYDKELKEYEQRLTVLNERVKSELSRQSEDFKLWTVKRHQAYVELHEAIIELVKKIREIKNVGKPKFEEFGEKRIKELFTELNVSNGEIDDLLQKKDVTELANWWHLKRQIVIALEFGKVEQSLEKLGLYVTPGVKKTISEYIGKLFKMWQEYSARAEEEIIGKSTKDFLISMKINSAETEEEEVREELLSIMRNELSGNYIKNNE